MRYAAVPYPYSYPYPYRHYYTATLLVVSLHRSFRVLGFGFLNFIRISLIRATIAAPSPLWLLVGVSGERMSSPRPLVAYGLSLQRHEWRVPSEVSANANADINVKVRHPYT